MCWGKKGEYEWAWGQTEGRGRGGGDGNIWLQCAFGKLGQLKQKSLWFSSQRGKHNIHTHTYTLRNVWVIISLSVINSLWILLAFRGWILTMFHCFTSDTNKSIIYIKHSLKAERNTYWSSETSKHKIRKKNVSRKAGYQDEIKREEPSGQTTHWTIRPTVPSPVWEKINLQTQDKQSSNTNHRVTSSCCWAHTWPWPHHQREKDKSR